MNKSPKDHLGAASLMLLKLFSAGAILLRKTREVCRWRFLWRREIDLAEAHIAALQLQSLLDQMIVVAVT